MLGFWERGREEESKRTKPFSRNGNDRLETSLGAEIDAIQCELDENRQAQSVDGNAAFAFDFAEEIGERETTGHSSQLTTSFGLCISIHCIAFPYRSRAKAYTARPPSAVSELDAPETMTVIKAHRQLAPAMDCVLLKMISMTGTPVGVDAVVSMSPMQKQRAMRACERMKINALAGLDLR